MATFTTNPFNLQQLLNEIKTGEIQLPDFQRSWKWNDEQIRRLLASVSLSHPIGALMMLDTGNSEVNFSSRLFAGVDEVELQPQASKLVLDGQQRLTSLFLTLKLLSKQPVKMTDDRGKEIEIYYYYYIDIKKALDPNVDREEAIISLPKDKKQTSNFGKHIVLDLSTPEQEYENEIFPLNQIFDHFKWSQKYNHYWQHDDEKVQKFAQFTQTIIDSFKAYQIPVITLTKNTSKEAICQVFENVNKSGVSLTVFELLTATFASNNFKLREDWIDREKRLQQKPVLQEVENTDFLQAVTLVKTYHEKPVSCKRKDILNLKQDNYNNYADQVTEGFEKVAKLLESEKILYSIDLPNKSQPIALAAIYAILGDLADSNDTKAKLLRWYWCGVFGKMYGSSTDTRLAKDVSQVINWIKKGGNEPDTIQEANFVADRILDLSTRISTDYKGLSALIAQQECHDFCSGSTVDKSIESGQSIDIHHIFPKQWCKTNNILEKQYNCIVNKTLLTATTNRMIGGKKPSIYINKLQTSPYIVSEEEMDERLRTHLIEPSVFRADDFVLFFDKRKYALLSLIEKAMGKPVVYPASQP